MMEVMLVKKLMNELAAPLKLYPRVLENVRVTDKKANPAVQEAVSKVAEALGDTDHILFVSLAQSLWCA